MFYLKLSSTCFVRGASDCSSPDYSSIPYPGVVVQSGVLENTKTTVTHPPKRPSMMRVTVVPRVGRVSEWPSFSPLADPTQQARHRCRNTKLQAGKTEPPA